nr:hypothetical protein [Alphaproteobacteria bacterium]
WLWAIKTLLCASFAVFLLIVLVNAQRILVGDFLLTFQIAIAAVVAVVALALCLWVFNLVLHAIACWEGEIQANLEAVRKTILRTAQNLGSDFLSLYTGALAFLILESIGTFPLLYKISIPLLFALNFFLASQLIGSLDRFQKVIGVFFFLAPVLSFLAALWVLVPQSEILQWMSARSGGELILLSFVVFSGLLTFAFAFLKNLKV